MRAYAYILNRLVSCWGMIPLEVIAAGILVTPGMVGFLAGLPYVLNLVASTFALWWCTGILKEYLWPDIPPEHQRFVLALRDRVLLRPPDRARPASEAECPEGTIRRSDEGRRPDDERSRSSQVR